MKEIIKLYHKHIELLHYIIIGVITTSINILTYFLATRLFSIGELFANTTAWSVAFVFSFFASKQFVFMSNDYSFKTVKKELLAYFSGRFATLILDEVIVIVGIKVLMFEDMLVQIVKHAIIIILNYFLGKIAFKTKGEIV